MKSLTRMLLILLATAVMATSTASAGDLQRQLAAESTIERILKRGTLRVGMDIFEPWAMKDKSGNLVGFEIDVAKRLAKDMGVKAVFVPTKWGGIIPALLTGKFDVIIGGMGITPSRNLKVNFSNPYYFTGMSMVANRKLADGFKSLEDFNRPDVVLAVRLGSTQVDAAKKYMPQAKLREFDGEAQCYQEVINGKAHAAIGSAPTPAYRAIKYPEQLFLPLKENFTKEPIGFAVPKGDHDTLNYFNNWIQVVQSEGFIQERKSYWFGSMAWEPLVR